MLLPLKDRFKTQWRKKQKPVIKKELSLAGVSKNSSQLQEQPRKKDELKLATVSKNSAQLQEQPKKDVGISLAKLKTSQTTPRREEQGMLLTKLKTSQTTPRVEDKDFRITQLKTSQSAPRVEEDRFALAKLSANERQAQPRKEQYIPSLSALSKRSAQFDLKQKKITTLGMVELGKNQQNATGRKKNESIGLQKLSQNAKQFPLKVKEKPLEELIPLEKVQKTIPPQLAEANFSESFSQGKNSREEDSKITFNELDVAMNVTFESENIIPRKGTTTFVTDTNILDIGIFKGINGNELISVYKNLTNSKIKKIDRTTGVISDYNTINYIATTEVFTQGATGKLTRASATDLTTILTIGDTIRIDIAVSPTGYKEIIAVVEYVEATYFTLVGYPSFYAGGVTKVLYTSNTTTISLNGTDIDFASGAGAMYFSDNTSGIQVITSGVSYVPYITAPGNAHRLTYCSGRLWAAGDDGVLYYSKKISSGSVQSFDITAENDTGGATTTNVGEVIALGSYGSRVIVFGRNSIEVHTAPAFTGGEITFGEAPNTLLNTFDGYGITNRKAFCITGSVVYFVNNGGFYQYLLGDTPPRNINKNRGEHKTLSFNQAAMFFDEDNQTIYIACTKQGSANDYGISYKIVEHGNLENNAFSNFDNIDVKSFAGDSEDIYYLQSYAGVIKRIEGTSDDGLPINCSIVSANINNGDVRYIKVAKKLYLNAESDGGDVINYAFYKNTKDNTNAAPSFNYTATIPAYSGFSVGVEGAFGLTPWGLSSYSTVNNENREMMWFSKNIGSQYLRGKVGLTFSTLNKLQIRGLGWYFTRTVKRSQDIEFG